MKHLLLYLSAFTCAAVYSQPSVQPLIKAEKDFEQLSHKEGLKKAFTFFADSNGLTFTDSGAVNAHQYWSSRPGGSGFFSWAPSYAEISDGSDWGFTTGAAQFRRKSLTDTVAFASQYTTVWHKDKTGNWKYLMDIGISHASIPPETICRNVSAKKTSNKDTKNSTIVLVMDKNFNNALITNAKAAYTQYASKQYLLNNDGHFITTSVDSAIEATTNRITACTPNGVLVAPKADMAFVYGRFRRGENKANYVRIWRHEPAGWKIALEVYQ